ncbi:serine/threonine-protein kinase [Actinophytocola oryzae]|uniref:non-specific serine/threonine protein kinase n=1 Tax=Actinophytocola oryzae TaxID=502181 RepID=A0A4R7UXZ8_9PSEU|nr:serine/threonine-protein kinase [Actinophytocola oryzae]TDV40942.1 serine/threonine-protein kinase [Actinophytocola oryzae]
MWEFGRYRIDELIARGGMGEVYRAYDKEHDRVVAVKLLADHFAQDDDFRRRFTREARAAARLREPHVIPIHAYGEIDGHLYLDMRLVDGEDLSNRLAGSGPPRPAAAVDIIGQVAGALDAAHAEGLVHRDVKPSNVLLDAGGFAYLIDFGIARTPAANADITGTGMPVGTVAYMAPERFTSEPTDHRVDVYSLACLLFECLTGTAPFAGGNALALMHAHVNQDPPRVTASRPDLPPAFDVVVATGMAKDPARRFPTAGALAAAARDALTHRPPTVPAPRLGRPRTTNRWWVAGVTTLVFVAVAGAAVLIWLSALRDKDGQDTSAGQTTTTTAVTTPAPAPSPDLALSVPLTTPACDGGYIVIVGSAVDPSRYGQDVQAFLDANPGSSYLHAPTTGCQSLRARRDGVDIYSVYFGPFTDRAQACARRGAMGEDAYLRRLDDTSAPGEGVSCG